MKRTLVAAVCALLAGCFANPTPHPEGPDSLPGAQDVHSVGDPGMAPDDGRDVCQAIGGSWDENASVCVFSDVQAAFNGGTDWSDPSAKEASPSAIVKAVTVTGEANAYTFEVTVESPDTGCEQYADWWEVISFEVGLVYRRILEHSHADEQPFTRDGGPIDIDADTLVVVRAHMSTGDYPTRVMIGSPAIGFTAAELPIGFGALLEGVDPQPAGCAR